MMFSDLPNGGRNLRLYTYDPPGSQYGIAVGAPCGSGSQGVGFIYNTGHFDIGLGIPCSQPDPQGFCDSASMDQYAAARGEIAVMVSRSDLTTLCGYRATTQPVVRTPQPTIVGTTPGSGGVTGVTVSGGGGAVPGYVPAPGTPIQSGGLPAGAGTRGTPALTQLYRFILYDPSSTNPNGPYSTGANYSGCSQVNTANCKAMNFPSEAAAVAYAESHGEIPYRVLSAQEPWGIMDGSIPIDPSRLLGQPAQGLSLSTIGLIGLGLWFLSRR